MSILVVAIVLTHVASMYWMWRIRERPRWRPADHREPSAARTEDVEETQLVDRSTHHLWSAFAGLSALVLVGGWLVTNTADAMAEQTGLGSAFLGATLLATATSLPEMSTTITATRGGRHTTAISNIFGSNAFDVSLLVVADVLYRDGSILAHAEQSAVFVAAVGAVLTCIYLWGLLERTDQTVGAIGWDSAAVLVVYALAMMVLYRM